LKPEERVERPLPTGIKRILLIDDEPAIANMVERTLKSLGYDVTTRTSSIEALKMFKAQKADLILSLPT
jgi:CheY-like chemotaxis protein